MFFWQYNNDIKHQKKFIQTSHSKTNRDVLTDFAIFFYKPKNLDF